jgi:hypothetical protein
MDIAMRISPGRLSGPLIPCGRSRLILGVIVRQQFQKAKREAGASAHRAAVFGVFLSLNAVRPSDRRHEDLTSARYILAPNRKGRKMKQAIFELLSISNLVPASIIFSFRDRSRARVEIGIGQRCV